MKSPTKPLRAIGWPAVSTPEQALDEKESIPAQRRDILSVIDDNNWKLVDMLEVPGFSRKYLTLREFSEEASKEGIDAGLKLEKHFAAQDFDVFIVRDGDRFGRSQALFAYIAEYIMYVMKKSIYAINGGGLINEQNGGREWITMQSYRATKHIDDLVRYAKMGKQKRASRGLLVSSRDPLSHRTVRDYLGKALRVEVREDLRRLWDDLATVILAGVSWWEIERVLFKDYGHVRDNGKRYVDVFFYRLVHNPVFWGHVAQNINARERGRDIYLYDAWVYDESALVPEGITVHRNVLPPVWEGDLAERIKLELRRRHEFMVGTRRPHNTYPFSSLLVCAYCGRNLNIHQVLGFTYYRCRTNRVRNRQGLKQCPAKHYIRHETVVTFLTPHLIEIIETQNPNINPDRNVKSAEHQLEVVSRDAETTQQELERLIMDRVRSKTPAVFDSLIEQSETKLLSLQSRKLELEQTVLRHSRMEVSQRLALEELTNLGVERFWQQEARFINQTLHALLAGTALLCEDDRIVGFTRLKTKPFRRKNTLG